jgi:hypothetical protein
MKKNVVYKTVLSKKLAGWVGGWVGGWMDGRESRVRDCLQQSKSNKMGFVVQGPVLSNLSI